MSNKRLILIGLLVFGLTYLTIYQTGNKLVQPKDFYEQEYIGAYQHLQMKRANRITGDITAADRYSILNTIEQTANKSGSSIDLGWEEFGPDDVGGRTRAIWIDRQNDSIVYAGGVSGGLFRSDQRV
ncbi:MAG: hypothetical protein IH946_06840 [Bacteroidetes bacterium]|nr:hypothetical protein [Bacteroidota bacterium]